MTGIEETVGVENIIRMLASNINDNFIKRFNV